MVKEKTMSEKRNMYIGARYVPLFDGEHSDTKTYEPLTIVAKNGNSYTSRTHVPIGIEITNSKFWALTGNYNAQIEQYRQDVRAFESKISGNKELIDKNIALIEKIDNRLAQEQSKTQEIANKVEENTDNINRLTMNTQQQNRELTEFITSQVEKIAKKTHLTIKDKKFILLGDSYNDGEGGIIGRGWGYYFKEWNGVDAHIIQQRAGGFFAVGSENADYPNKKFWEIIEIYGESKSEEERKSVDYIVCYAGYNDARNDVYDADGIIDSIEKFKKKCDQYFPNAKIVEIPNFNAGALTHWERIKGFDAVCFACQQNGIATYKNAITWFTGRDTYMASDEIHLSDKGYRLAAKYITAILNGWDGEYSFSTSAGVELGRGITIPSSNRFYVMRDGDMTVIQGTLKNASLQDGDVLFTVPPECRPQKTLTFAAYGSNGAHMVIIDLKEKAVVRGHTNESGIETEIYFCHTFKTGY